YVQYAITVEIADEELGRIKSAEETAPVAEGAVPIAQKDGTMIAFQVSDDEVGGSVSIKIASRYGRRVWINLGNEDRGAKTGQSASLEYFEPREPRWGSPKSFAIATDRSSPP